MHLTTRDLRSILPQTGRLEWIGLRPARHAPVRVVDRVDVLAGKGLVGDRASQSRSLVPERIPNRRQVTLFQAEHLAVLASLLGKAVLPEQLRRNLHIAGINLHALKGRRFAVGPVVLQHTGLCDPCHNMEDTLGPGGFNAMRMHCGITAKVLTGGSIAVGDPVRLLE